jgi:hypothetical protein
MSVPLTPNNSPAAANQDRTVDPAATTHTPSDTGLGRADRDSLVDPAPTTRIPLDTSDSGQAPGRATAVDRDTVITREKERYGGVKIGSAFFGWLTATGMAVLLISLLTAAGVAFGLATSQTVDQAIQESANATGTAQTVGLVGAITLLVILFVAYFCGGYVAGRMARFNGIRQGLAVWLWGVIIAIIIAALAAVAGSQYNVYAQLNLPRIPVNEGDVTTVGIIVIAAAILTALIGALLGGLAGMRFHRRIDAEGLGPR